MTPERRRYIDALLKSDFTAFAPRILRIRPKEGGKAVPLVLNAAQRHIHEMVTIQEQSTGKVRAILLKGRQQGGCLDPATPVLTAGLRWVPIGSLKAGDEVVATDEYATDKARQMRTATVEKVWWTEKQSYRITFDDGRSVVCSGEHRWLTRKSAVVPQWRSIHGDPNAPDKRGAIKVGDSIRSVTRTWGDATLDDAWFGGVIDGEGSLYCGPTGVDIAVSQRANAVFDEMVRHCAERDYGAYIVSDDGPRKTKYGREAVHAVTIGHMSAMFRLMGLSRPRRFIDRRWWEGRKLPSKGWREIVSIEPLGARKLVDIQTTTRTFIAEGLVSHNSTYVEGRFYWRISYRRGVKGYILTHEQKATDNLFGMVERYWAEAPADYRPHLGASNAKELVFSKLDSRYEVATAGAKDTGRSGTAQYLHGSEVAFWQQAATHMAGIGQVVPDAAGTEIVLESTANGTANVFHELWQMAVKGKSEYVPIFVPWFWQEEYVRPAPAGLELTIEDIEYQEAFGLSLDRMAWRRNKIDGDFRGDISLFDQEYPASAELAFASSSPRSLIKASLVAKARRARDVEAVGPLIMAVDPAEYGDDSTSVSTRQGRVAKRVGKWSGLGTMETVGRVSILADEIGPQVIYVDATGVGTGVADRLKELGYPVVRVHFGESPRDIDRYVLCRDEMWGEMKDWLEDGPVSIEDSDDLASQLTSVQYGYDSKRRLKLEPKEKMKDRGLSSPDDGDSLALTFYRGAIRHQGDPKKFKALRGW